MDINEVFRGGGRSIEFLDRINKASLVMLEETGIVPRSTAQTIARGIEQIVAGDAKTYLITLSLGCSGSSSSP